MTSLRRPPALSSNEQRMIAIGLRLAEDPHERQREMAHRHASRLASILGAVAALLSLYDLTLLATIGRH